MQGAGVATNAPKVALDMVGTNVIWLSKYETQICEFLKSYQHSTPESNEANKDHVTVTY